MLDEHQKQAYEQQWQARERERIAKIKAARELGRTASADKIAREAEKRRRENRSA